jgi:sugar phosphate permease
MNKHSIFQLCLSIGSGFVIGSMTGNLIAEGNWTGVFLFVALASLIISVISKAEQDRKNMMGD